jgi:transglutaminase-like putative cysteine protease
LQADITHQTQYRFSGPVRLQPHVLRLRPRSEPRQSVITFDCAIEPVPAGSSWSLDAEGNAAMQVWFSGETEFLEIHTHCRVVTYADNPFDFILTGAGGLPMIYSSPEMKFLTSYLTRPEPSAQVDAYVQEIAQRSQWQTLDFLSALNRAIASSLRPIERESGQPFAPEDTLQKGEGACRDLAVLFIDCCRSVGIAARFVSGYSLNEQDQSRRRLHAWAEIYLPGGGWRGYDPSEGLAVADRHVALAASGVTALAAPVTGSFSGGQVSSVLEVRIEINLESFSA